MPPRGAVAPPYRLTGERFSNAEPWGEQQDSSEPLGQWIMDYPNAGPSRLVQLLPDRIEIWQPQDNRVRRRSPLPTFFSGYLPR